MDDDEIMCAVSRALRSEGYADLTMQDIADETSLSKAALHYHYDSKRDLLVAFQEYIGEQFLARVREAVADTSGPAAELDALLETALTPPDSADVEGLQTALLELRAQAPYVDEFREGSRSVDVAFREITADVIERGRAAGAFHEDVDPEAAASFVSTVIEGYQVRSVVVDQDPAAPRTQIEQYLTRAATGPETGDVEEAE